MSMRHDLLPSEYCSELEKLRTDAHSMDYTEVKKQIESEYQCDLTDVFSEFSKEPLGAASIAEVHAAKLLSGEKVVVKVQRPGIHDIMQRDIRLLHKAASILKVATSAGNVVDFHMILDEMWLVAQQEMDFLMEARNAEEFAQLNRDVAFVACPYIKEEYTTAKVLVMEYVDGISIDKIDVLSSEGYDLKEIGEKLTDHYMKQVVDDGFFHADPHPGNLCIRDGKIVYIDMGMMGRINSRDRELFEKAISCVAMQDINGLEEVVLALGQYTERINHAKLYTGIDGMLSKYGTMEIANINIGDIFEEFFLLLGEHKISLPKGMSMLGRGLVTLEGVVRVLSPELNIVKIMEHHFSVGFLENFDAEKTIKQAGQAMYESASKGLHIPAQLSDVLKMNLKGQTKINMEITGSEQPLSMIDKMVNKLIVCIITASIVVGSSLICTTDMSPKVFGIPAMGVMGYFAALVLCVWILIDVKWKKH